jgi:hypothetical protein
LRRRWILARKRIRNVGSNPDVPTNTKNNVTIGEFVVDFRTFLEQKFKIYYYFFFPLKKVHLVII